MNEWHRPHIPSREPSLSLTAALSCLPSVSAAVLMRPAAKCHPLLLSGFVRSLWVLEGTGLSLLPVPREFRGVMSSPRGEEKGVCVLTLFPRPLLPFGIDPAAAWNGG